MDQATEVKKVETTRPEPIDVQHGALVPKNSSELHRTLASIAAGQGFPERFDTPEKRIAAYNLAHSLMGSKWQLALNHMANIKGQLTIYGELPGALAEATGEVVEKKVFALDKDAKVICMENGNLSAPAWAGVCRIKRKGRELKEFSYTMDEAIAAGQYPAKRRDGSIIQESPWMRHTKVMLMRKAQALAIKFEFPDAILGSTIAEYVFDEAPDLKDVTPRGSISEVDEARNRIMETRNAMNQVNDKTSGQESMVEVELMEKEATNG